MTIGTLVVYRLRVPNNDEASEFWQSLDRHTGAIPMHTKLVFTLSIVVLSSLLGCEAQPVENLPLSPKSDVSLVVPPASVTTPSSDVSSPPVGTAALRKDEGPTGATTGSALTSKELNTQMPLAGQVNDHSTDERAKQGQAPGTSVN